MVNDVAAVVLAIVFAAVIGRQLAGRGPPVWTVFAAGLAVIFYLTR